MTANQDLFDNITLHAIRVEFLKNGVVKRMLSLLSQSDDELTAKLRIALENLSGTKFSIDRIEAQLQSIYEINASLYREMQTALDAELSDFAEYETSWQQRDMQKVLPVDVPFTRIGTSQIYAAAVARPFQGRLLSEWMDELETEAAKRVRDAVRLGIIQNETTDQIVRRIRGTRAMGYKDGLIAISRRQAATIVRTAISHTASVARNAVYEANRSVIANEIWVSVLDSRTSPECQQLDGKIFKLGAGPYPPIHFNCRSVRLPVLKKWSEIFGKDVDVPASTRASMNGQVPEDMKYGTWLRRQSVAVQDEVLGKERGRIFRETGAPLDKFINREGKYYTLVELKTLEL